MADRVARHYSENLALADVVALDLRSAGKDLNKLTTTDLATVDEFHIRGRKGTLELAGQIISMLSRMFSTSGVVWAGRREHSLRHTAAR